MRRWRPLRALGRGLLAVGLSVAVLAGAVAAVGATLERLRPGPEPEHRCFAELDGTRWSLSPEQAQNAALFAAMAAERDLPARAVTIAIATALQESRMINIDYGDRDSVGLFQQRPSQGWGTVEEIMDPVYSTGRFYAGLVKVPGYTELEVTVAAQAVQRSGFPDAYAQHETRARAWASALTGQSAGTMTCELRASLPAGDVAGLVARAARDLPSAQAVPDAAARVVALAGGDLPEAGTAQRGWALASWAVAQAAEHQVVAVHVADQRWDRADGAWHQVENSAAQAPGQVLVRLAE